MAVHTEIDASLPREARNWAMACHLSALLGLVSGIGFVLGPLIVWLVKREDHPFIDEQGKQAVNFQLTMFGAFFLAAILIFAVVGIFLLPLLGILDVVLTVVAGIKAANGEHWSYPFAFRILQ